MNAARLKDYYEKQDEYNSEENYLSVGIYHHGVYDKKFKKQILIITPLGELK